MTFLNIDDTDKLIGVLDECADGVDLIAPDGKAYDWHTHGDALRLLLSETKHIDKLEVRARSGRDSHRMFRLMMEERAV